MLSGMDDCLVAMCIGNRDIGEIGVAVEVKRGDLSRHGFAGYRICGQYSVAEPDLADWLFGPIGHEYQRVGPEAVHAQDVVEDRGVVAGAFQSAAAEGGTESGGRYGATLDTDPGDEIRGPLAPVVAAARLPRVLGVQRIELRRHEGGADIHLCLAGSGHGRCRSLPAILDLRVELVRVVLVEQRREPVDVIDEVRVDIHAVDVGQLAEVGVDCCDVRAVWERLSACDPAGDGAAAAALFLRLPEVGRGRAGAAAAAAVGDGEVAVGFGVADGVGGGEGVAVGVEGVVVAGGAVVGGGLLERVALAQHLGRVGLVGLAGLVVFGAVGGVGVHRGGRAGVGVLVEGGDAAVHVLAVVVAGREGRWESAGAAGAAVAKGDPVPGGVVQVGFVAGQGGPVGRGADRDGGLVLGDRLVGKAEVGEGGGAVGDAALGVGLPFGGDAVQRVVDVGGAVGLGAGRVVAAGAGQVVEVVVGVDLPQAGVGGGAVGVPAGAAVGDCGGGDAPQPAQVVVPVFGGDPGRVGLAGLLGAGVAAAGGLGGRAGHRGLGGDVAGPDGGIGAGGAAGGGAVQGVAGLGAVPVACGDQPVAGVVDVAGGAGLAGAGPVEREPVAGADAVVVDPGGVVVADRVGLQHLPRSAADLQGVQLAVVVVGPVGGLLGRVAAGGGGVRAAAAGGRPGDDPLGLPAGGLVAGGDVLVACAAGPGPEVVQVGEPVPVVVDQADPVRRGGLAAFFAVVAAGGHLPVVGVGVGRDGLEGLALELAGGRGELAVAVVAGADGHGGLAGVGHADVADRGGELAVGVIGVGGGVALGVAAGTQGPAGEVAPQLGLGRLGGRRGGGPLGLPPLSGVVETHRRVRPGRLGGDPARIPVADLGLRRRAQRARRPRRIGVGRRDADRQRAARQPPVRVIGAVQVAGGGRLSVAGGPGRQAGDRQLVGLVIGQPGDKAVVGGLAGAGVVAARAAHPGAVAVGVVAVQGAQRPGGGERRVHAGGQATLVVVVAGGLAGLIHLVLDGAVGVVVAGHRPRRRGGGGQRLHRGGGAVGQVVAGCSSNAGPRGCRCRYRPLTVTPGTGGG